MLKFFLKVAGKTILAIVCVAALCVVCIAAFAPKWLAQATDSLGIESQAKIYAVKAYKKDSSVENLAFLVNVSIKSGDVAYTNLYSLELLSRDDFETYVQSKNDGGAYYDFVASAYIKSSHTLSEFTAKELAEKALTYSKENYAASNAVESLILKCSEEKDVATLKEIKTVLKNFEASGGCPSSSTDRLSRDIENLQLLIERLTKQSTATD
jgi:hypothetical protein